MSNATEYRTIADNLPPDKEMYEALLERDASYEGVFVAGIKTTGIFCRPTCSAKKPLSKNVEYFQTPREAILSGYRACKRCRPLELKDSNPEWLNYLLDAVDSDPTKRWKDGDIRRLDLHPERVRRWFKEHHSMTFHTYVRLRRLSEALGRLKRGDELARVAFETGFESLSGFRDAFMKIFGVPPGKGRTQKQMAITRITTPLGPMLAGATDDGVCLLEFVDRRMLEVQIRRVVTKLDVAATPGEHKFIERAESELQQYFAGTRKDFTVPTAAPGSDFQRACWNWLTTIPYGEVRSYADQARALDKPGAHRAVGRANGDNPVAIVVPCHRVVRSDGQLAGYGGGLWRKKRLLEIENDNNQGE